jgi:hypothetical protein
LQSLFAHKKEDLIPWSPNNQGEELVHDKIQLHMMNSTDEKTNKTSN